MDKYVRICVCVGTNYCIVDIYLTQINNILTCAWCSVCISASQVKVIDAQETTLPYQALTFDNLREIRNYR